MRTKIFLTLVLLFFISPAWNFAEAAPDIIVGEEHGAAGGNVPHRLSALEGKGLAGQGDAVLLRECPAQRTL